MVKEQNCDPRSCERTLWVPICWQMWSLGLFHLIHFDIFDVGSMCGRYPKKLIEDAPGPGTYSPNVSMLRTSPAYTMPSGRSRCKKKLRQRRHQHRDWKEHVLGLLKRRVGVHSWIPCCHCNANPMQRSSKAPRWKCPIHEARPEGQWLSEKVKFYLQYKMGHDDSLMFSLHASKVPGDMVTR